MIGVPFFLASIRFLDYLRGGVFTFRDAGFFFVPWRSAVVRNLTSGSFPYWNDWMSCGRALAADPNGGVFFPLTYLAVPFGMTALGLANVALALGMMLAALRWLGLGRMAAAAGTTILLFSGVFQTLPILFSSLGAAAPIPLAWVAFWFMGDAEGRRLRRLMAGGALALALSALAGEPAVTAIGGAGALFLLFVGSRGKPAGNLRLRGKPFFAGAAAVALAIGLAAVQLAPAFSELRRSARSESMRPEHGTLYWSVRPARILTLLEPRLTGDPFSEVEAGYWGAGTFDAGNPYFYDLALGLIPLLFAISAVSDRRGRAFLFLAGLGAVASLGRYLPGFRAIAGLFSIFRYPEKWWIVVTYALVAAAAIGIELFLREEKDERAQRGLRRVSLIAAAFLSLGAISAFLFPRGLKNVLWSLGLGAGAAPAEIVAGALRPVLLAAAASAAVLAFVLPRAGRLPRPLVLSLLALLFLSDGVRRIAGTCPAGSPGLHENETPAVQCVKRNLRGGRFFDDGAGSIPIALRRVTAGGGFDPLRPESGVLFGIRYAFENDIDRMMPAASVAAAQGVSKLPFGQEKLDWLRAAGVTLVRTAALPPDPAGTRELWRTGADRFLRIEGARPEFSLVSSVRGEGLGTISILLRRIERQRLDVRLTRPDTLAIARTFDPSWKVTVNGAPARLEPSFGGLSALRLPAGLSRVECWYENRSLRWGAFVSFLAALVAALLFFFKGRSA